jgi:hypothetical protein
MVSIVAPFHPEVEAPIGGLSLILSPITRVSNSSQIHECRNWEWGRAVSFWGWHKSDFRYSLGSFHFQRGAWSFADKTAINPSGIPTLLAAGQTRTSMAVVKYLVCIWSLAPMIVPPNVPAPKLQWTNGIDLTEIFFIKDHQLESRTDFQKNECNFFPFLVVQ